MLVKQAIEQTNAAGTARFEGGAREGGPLGPAPWRHAREVVGIADFEARRAILRDKVIPTGFWGGMLGRTRALGSREGPFVLLVEGRAVSFADPRGGWSESHPGGASMGLPRLPPELQFLDLVRPREVLEERAVGEEEVRGVNTTRVGLSMRFDRSDWPKPDRSAEAADTKGVLARLAVRVLPDPRPHGIVRAEMWVDDEYLLRRFSLTWMRVQPAKAIWSTTELWDFGVPLPIGDRLSQAVIDPVTMEPVTIGPAPR